MLRIRSLALSAGLGAWMTAWGLGSVALGWTRPTTPPSSDSSDDYAVTKVVYDSAGRQQQVIDNKGLITYSEYDPLGRRTKQIENYVDGAPSDGDDRTTLYAYNGADQIVTQTADLPTGQTWIDSRGRSS